MADQHDIKEDTVLYRVYPYGDDIALTQAAITCNSDVEKLVGDHIWYYEPVRLTEQIGTHSYTVSVIRLESIGTYR